MQLENGGHGGCAESKILEFESNLGVNLPPDYRRFLLDYNGGTPVTGGFDVPGWGDSLVNKLFGLGFSDYRSIDRAITARIDVHSKTQTIPIGYDPGGNGIFMGVAKENFGIIYFFDHEDECQPLIELSPSFDSFMKTLYEDE